MKLIGIIYILVFAAAFIFIQWVQTHPFADPYNFLF